MRTRAHEKNVLESSLMRRGIEKRLRRGQSYKIKNTGHQLCHEAVGMWQASEGKSTDAYLLTVAKLIGLSRVEWPPQLGTKEPTINLGGHSLRMPELQSQNCCAFKFQKRSPIIPGSLILLLWRQYMKMVFINHLFFLIMGHVDFQVKRTPISLSTKILRRLTVLLRHPCFIVSIYLIDHHLVVMNELWNPYEFCCSVLGNIHVQVGNQLTLFSTNSCLWLMWKVY